MRWASLVFVVACYSPSPEAGAPCSPTGLCPSPLVCRANACVAAGATGTAIDAPIHPADTSTGIDSPSPVADGAGPIDANPNPTGAALLLHMDDDPSDGATDSAGGHTVTCGKCPFKIPSGRIGAAYRFKGESELDVTGEDLDPQTAFSLVTWVRLDAPVGSGTTDGFYLLASKNLTDDASYALLVNTSMEPGYYTSGAGTSAGQAGVATATLSTGTWHHLAMTWDGATVTGYLDGAQVVTNAVASVTTDATMPLSIGLQTGASDGLVGDLDELAYYTRALGAAEVAALANP